MNKSKMNKISALVMAVSLLLASMASSALADTGDVIVAIQAVEETTIPSAEPQVSEPEVVYTSTITDTGAVNVEPQSATTPAAVETQAPAAQAVRQMYRVEFFLNEECLGYVDVQEGDFLLAPDYIPEIPGFQFEYWYDYGLHMEQLKEFPYLLPSAYVFGSPVVGNMILCPYFTELPQAIAPVEAISPEQAGQTITVNEEQTQQLINQIIGASTPVELADESSEEINVQPSARIEEQANDLIQQLLGNIAPVNAEPVNDDTVQPVGENTVAADDQAQDLINSILASDDIGSEPSVVEDEDDAFIIEDEEVALAGPKALAAALPSVHVSYEYEGSGITEGTLVTVRAELVNIPEGVNVAFQWLSNANGAFEEIAQNGQSFSFYADETNTNCEYQVNVTLG